MGALKFEIWGLRATAGLIGISAGGGGRSKAHEKKLSLA